MKKSERIEKSLKILSKIYYSHDKTTLNRMRRKPDAFKILISCLLSLRTQDKNTEKASKKLFAVADTPEKIVKIPIKKLEKLIFSSGHYKKKARTLQHVSKELINKFNSKVPKTKEELLSIKGIGPKTANIVLAFAFGKNVIPVDTHVHRIPNRLGWVKTATFVGGKEKKSPFHTSRKEREKNKGLSRPEQTEKELEKILPKKYWKEFNAIFVQFGQTICQPISPWCSKCPISKYCPRIGVNRSR